jgi:hypothetical protein
MPEAEELMTNMALIVSSESEQPNKKVRMEQRGRRQRQRSRTKEMRRKVPKRPRKEKLWHLDERHGRASQKS